MSSYNLRLPAILTIAFLLSILSSCKKEEVDPNTIPITVVANGDTMSMYFFMGGHRFTNTPNSYAMSFSGDKNLDDDSMYLYPNLSFGANRDIVVGDTFRNSHTRGYQCEMRFTHWVDGVHYEYMVANGISVFEELAPYELVFTRFDYNKDSTSVCVTGSVKADLYPNGRLPEDRSENRMTVSTTFENLQLKVN